MGNGESVPPSTTPTAQHKVQLAATPISPFIPTAPRAYHTSVIVDNIEYFFCRRGVVSARNYQSHVHLPNGPDSIVDIGYSHTSGSEMMQALRPYFKENTYDLLRKNCNSFSDSAIFYLCDQRLESKYSELEQIGTSADKHIGLVRMLSLGEYGPNPKAQTFKLDRVLTQLKKAKAADKENCYSPDDKQAVARQSKLDYKPSPKACKYKPTPKDNNAELANHRQQTVGAASSHLPPPSTQRGSVEKRTYSLGQRVKVFSSMNKGWVGATVKTSQADGGITVLYDTGDFQKDIPMKQIPNYIRRQDG